jgi:hypothetical protein
MKPQQLQPRIASYCKNPPKLETTVSGISTQNKSILGSYEPEILERPTKDQ